MADPQQGWTVHRLPVSHWHCALWNFEWARVKPEKLESAVLEFTHALQDGKSPHLLLTGSPGIGKSHIGVGVYRAASVVWGTELVTWLNVPAFCDRVKKGYGDGTDLWQDIEHAKRLVVLDDLFGRELTGHDKDQIVTRLIQTAYDNRAGVLATMNQDVSELATRLPPHEISRLLADAHIKKMSASQDYRRI